MKQKNLFKGFLAIVLLLCSSTSWAYDFEVDNIQYTITSFDDLTVEVSGLTNDSVTEVIIPETVEYRSRTLTVISIGSKAFYECSCLAIVDIPESVNSIGTYAFYGCSSLASVDIPENISKIEEYTFYGCSSLSEVTIHEKVTSIGNSAFSGCSGLMQLNFNALACTSAGSSESARAFSGCTNISTVIFGDSITVIPDYLCYGYTELMSVTIPNSVTKIGSYAFYNCKGLTEITIPDSVTSIGYHAFSGCTGLTSVTIGESVTTIGDYAFDNCTGLTEVTIPNSVNTIGDYAFYNCSSLKELDIPNSVTYYGKYALGGCTSLESLQVSAGLTDLYEDKTNNTFDREYFYYSALWKDAPSQMRSVILKDGSSSFHVRGYGKNATYSNNEGEPLFSNIDIGYYYVGRPLDEITQWKYYGYGNYNSERITFDITVKQPYGVIQTLEIGGNCTSVPYFYQSIEYLIIGKNVKTYTKSNIYETNLRGIMCKSETPPTLSGTFSNSTYLNAVLYVPTGSKETYEATEGWKNFWEIVEMDVDDMTPEYTAVDDIVVGGQANVIGYYTIDGKQVSMPQRGINIIRYSDGTSKKVLMR